MMSAVQRCLICSACRDHEKKNISFHLWHNFLYTVEYLGLQVILVYSYRSMHVSSAVFYNRETLQYFNNLLTLIDLSLLKNGIKMFYLL